MGGLWLTGLFGLLAFAGMGVHAEEPDHAIALGERYPVAPGRKSESPRRDPWCGPRSVWVAAARLGYSLDVNQLAQSCRMTEAGTSMLDLKHGATVAGLEAVGLRLTWRELIDLRTPAVLLVSGNHFCCADPREQAPGSPAQKVRVYDIPGPTLWMTQKELEAIWRGEALIVRRPASAGRDSSPVADFEETFADFGLAGPDCVQTHEYGLKNSGSSALRILALQKSCGCVTLEATPDLLMPGQAAKITMNLDLHGRQGAQLIQGYVRTNDPHRPDAVLTFRGVVERPVLVTPGRLDLGEVIRTQECAAEAVITDRGDQTLELAGGANVDLDGYFARSDRDTPPARAPEARPRFEVSCVPYDQPGHSARGPLPTPRERLAGGGEPLRYRVALRCYVGVDVPNGIYTGTLGIPGRRQSGENVQIPIPVAVEVADDLFPLPRILCFGVMKPSETRSRSISLQRRSGREVELFAFRQCDETHELRSDSQSVLPEPAIVSKGGDRAIVQLTLKAPPRAARTGTLLSGLIQIRAADAPEVQVKWLAVVQPPRTD